MATKKEKARPNGYVERNGFIVLTKEGTVLGPFESEKAANNFKTNLVSPSREPEVITYAEYTARKK